ncbi:winged helix-turn-helix domain-containing protein [Halorussus salilacus]|uniref:winged helix-turn-helix domain-containing protein n=1 Tax=Halorussus salilacus TaxID=2953750 RepID=UPI00209D6E5F|nr:winged helix-turn-helix domain-containing protein [Halorussus salilacus]USZ69120.1 winged helix-turn-helix domain-containing protein [Halorussus salilacus]
MSEDRTAPDGRGGTTEGDETGLDVPSPVPAERSLSASELDVLFELLADSQRRELLAYLVDADDGVASFSDLIDRVADAEDAADREVAISIRHAHLPKLADAGVVEYDERSETVRYRGDPALADWLDAVRE